MTTEQWLASNWLWHLPIPYCELPPISVIAEGVETQEQYAFLCAQQCTEGQGFYFSRALPADQLTAFLLVSGVFLRL